VHRLPAFLSALRCLSALSLLTINLLLLPTQVPRRLHTRCITRRVPTASGTPKRTTARTHTALLHILSQDQAPPKFGRSFNNRPHPLQKAKYLFLQLHLGTSHLRNHGQKLCACQTEVAKESANKHRHQPPILGLSRLAKRVE
jgi:hypothetical protein